MESSSECEYHSALAVAATVAATASSSSPYKSAEDESMMQSESLSWSMVQQRIEASKRDWSELSDGDRSLSGEEVAVENRKAFNTLQSHPDWGSVFWTFNDNSYGAGRLVVGEKFAEGGQAELYYAHVTWSDPVNRQKDVDYNIKHVLKLFKKGTLLRDVQGKWPHGFLKWKIEQNYLENNQRQLTPCRLFCISPSCVTMLEDGRFGFLMTMCKEDLQKFIKRRMHGQKVGFGPFLEKESDEIMYEVALGVLWLHEHDVVHRDLRQPMC